MDNKDFYLSKNLYKKILKASNEIAKTQRNPSANYMITSSEVADVINGIDEAERVRVDREKKLKRVLKKLSKKK